MGMGYIKIGKLAIMSIIYLGLSLFMLFVAVRTYQFSGGFSDPGTIAVVVGMVLLVVLILRVGYINLSGTFHG